MTVDWERRLRDHGFRITPQRQLVLEAVESLRHGTPEEILVEVQRTASGVNLSTIYRTLEVLEELGLVRHTHLSDRAPTYHSTREHEHVHAVCRRCHRVRSYDPAVVAPVVAVLGEDGFTVDVGHLAIFGVCADCASGDPT